MQKDFENVVRETVFDELGLRNTFFASPGNIKLFENSGAMTVCYDSGGSPIPGKYPAVPDLAAAGLWCTPKELLAIGKEFIAAKNGRSAFLREESAREMAEPVENFPWTGLGVFICGKDILQSQGWGENGQCMIKMNCRTGEVSVVMTNRDPGVDQAESGVERLVDRKMTEN